jgi:hypothetical protein
LYRLSSSFILGYHGCDVGVGERLLAGAARRGESKAYKPFVIGAVIELGLCLDLTTSSGLEWVKIAYESLRQVTQAASLTLPTNSKDQLRRNLDCAVIRRLHTILEAQRQPAIETLKGVFTEGQPVYPGAGFREKLTSRSPSAILDASKAYFACHRINFSCSPAGKSRTLPALPALCRGPAVYARAFP